MMIYGYVVNIYLEAVTTGWTASCPLICSNTVTQYNAEEAVSIMYTLVCECLRKQNPPLDVEKDGLYPLKEIPFTDTNFRHPRDRTKCCVQVLCTIA